MYIGALGPAFFLFKVYQVTNNKNDLNLCSDIVKACDSASLGSGHLTFICGQVGVFALGAIVAKHSADEQMCDHYLTKFNEIELLKISQMNYCMGEQVVNEIIKASKQLGNERCPLMYKWSEKNYWVAAYGIVGIMHVLMGMELKPDELEEVKGTLQYMMKNHYPSWNYPYLEGSELDCLVLWCHGAPGSALTLVKAPKVFGGEEFLKEAIDAGEVIWNRGLLNKVGICHGISGNAYVFLYFLSLYRLTGKVEYLYRAKAFACFLHDRAQILISVGIMHGGVC